MASSDTSARARLAVKLGAATVALLLPLVTQFEGYSSTVYRDPIGRLAVCWGHDDQSMNYGQRYTREQCANLLYADLLKHASALDCITRPMTDGQRAAFLSFAYNVGTGAFCKSTLARKANAGDMDGACAELSRWTRAGGVVWPGLVKRRALERKVCES